MPKDAADEASEPSATEAAGLSYDHLDELLGFRLRLAHIALYRDFASALGHLKLTQRQVAVLWLIGANPGVSQGELGAALATDRATMFAIIDRLEKEGRIVRRRSKTDRRRQDLRLTPAGVKALHDAKWTIVRHDSRLAAGLSESERSTLLTSLGKLARLAEADRTVQPER